MKLSNFFKLVYLMNQKRLQASEAMPALNKISGEFTTSRINTLNFFNDYGHFLEMPELEKDYEVDGTSVNIAIRYFNTITHIKKEKLGDTDTLLKLFKLGDKFCDLTNAVCAKQIEIVHIHTEFVRINSDELKNILDSITSKDLVKSVNNNNKLSGGAF